MGADKPLLLLDVDGPLNPFRARGRPFAWVDDGITAKEERFVAAHHEGPALLLPVDPRRGLGAADFAALEHWAEEVADDRG